MVRAWRKLVEEVFSSKTDEPPSDARSRKAAADVQRQGAAIILTCACGWRGPVPAQAALPKCGRCGWPIYVGRLPPAPPDCDPPDD